MIDSCNYPVDHSSNHQSVCLHVATNK